MKYYFVSFLLMAITFSFSPAHAQEKQTEKIEASVRVLKEFVGMKESIPAEMLKITEGIIIVPKLINAGFVLAGKRGKGIAVMKNPNGSWSNPVFITLTGGSVGFQAGIQSVDLVLIFTDANTLKNIGKGSFTLGGDISVTAGPVGRSSSASTDGKLEAEVYSYSRSKGLFAGISLSGSALDVDAKFNQAFYGNDFDAFELFSSSKKMKSPAVTALKNELKSLKDTKK